MAWRRMFRGMVAARAAKLASFLVHGNDQVLGRDLATAMTSAQVPMPDTGGQSSYGFGVVSSPGISLGSSQGAVHHYAAQAL